MTKKPELEPFTFTDQTALRGHLYKSFNEKGRQWVMGPDERLTVFSFSV